MAANESTPPPAVTGLADTRATSLAQLASGGQRASVVSLRHVLPTEEPQRLTVCAFASSI